MQLSTLTSNIYLHSISLRSSQIYCYTGYSKCLTDAVKIQILTSCNDSLNCLTALMRYYINNLLLFVNARFKFNNI